LSNKINVSTDIPFCIEAKSDWINTHSDNLLDSFYY
jgi:hypothetical protein